MNFGPDYTALNDGCYNGPWTHGNCANLGANSTNQGQPPQAGDFSQEDFTYTLDNILRLNKTLGGIHQFDITGLYSIQRDHFTKDSLYASNLPYPTQLWYDLGSGTAGNEVSRISEWALQSYMARVNYTLFDRYSLSGTVRSDGSSRLAPGHKWATFPSIGLAWQVGDEPFFRNIRSISALKLRGSYGSTGNTAISPYQTEGTLQARIYTFGGTRVQGYKPGSIPNPDLSWERTDQKDIGLDYALFNSRISGTIDWYNMKTHDLLLTELLPVTSGFASTLQNVGSTKNTGYEVVVHDGQSAELARPHLDERLQLVDEQEPDPLARQRRHVRRRQRLVRRIADQHQLRSEPAPVLRLQVHRRLAVRRLRRHEGLQRHRQHVQARGSARR